MISTIIKRDGREVDFDIHKISDAIFKAAEAIGGKDKHASDVIAQKVGEYLEND